MRRKSLLFAEKWTTSLLGLTIKLLVKLEIPANAMYPLNTRVPHTYQFLMIYKWIIIWNIQFRAYMPWFSCFICCFSHKISSWIECQLCKYPRETKVEKCNHPYNTSPLLTAGRGKPALLRQIIAQGMSMGESCSKFCHSALLNLKCWKIPLDS